MTTCRPVFLGPILLAAGVYLVLRWVIWLPDNRHSPVSVAKHALWVGVIGWLASSLQPAARRASSPSPACPAGAIQARHPPRPGLARPGLSLPCTPSASSATRAHGCRGGGRPSTCGGSAISCPVRWPGRRWPSSLWPPSRSPGPPPCRALLPCQYRAVPDGAGGSDQGGDGRIPGVDLAALLGGALAVLAAGTLLVLVLIASRRQAGSPRPGGQRHAADHRHEPAAADRGHGCVRAGRHRRQPSPPGRTRRRASDRGPTSPACNLVVLLAMWWWAPPKLSAGLGRHGGRRGATADSFQPATRLVVSLGPAMVLAVRAALVVAVLVPGAGTQPAVFVAVAAGAILAVLAGGEALLARNYGAAGRSAQWPRQPASPAVLATAVTAAAVLVAVIAVVAGRQSGLGVAGLLAGRRRLQRLRAGVFRAAVDAGTAAPRPRGSRRGLDAALRAITCTGWSGRLRPSSPCRPARCSSRAAPSLLPAWPLDPGPWPEAWQAAPWAGVLLATAGVVIAVVPVRALAGHKAGRRSPAPVA